MGAFLNSIVPFEAYKTVAAGRYFVDKSGLIAELWPGLEAEERFYCITRPRRFGKSVMANMVGAFFGKAADADRIFRNLEVSGYSGYQAHLNKHNVIYIDFSEVPRDCGTYLSYISRFQNGINEDLAEAYPDLDIDISGSTWDILSDVFRKTGDKFLFVIDEWDAAFHMSFVKEEDKKAYLLFLKSLLKGKVYVEFVYMTGVLPIAKYSSGSELNMFLEYDMATKVKFSEFFGFNNDEVDKLFAIYCNNTRIPRIAREDLSVWYDGYHTAGGERIYNPRSVVCALTDNQISNYWTSSGPYDEIFYYVRNNMEDVRDDFALMVSGESVEIKLEGYAATTTELYTKNQIYSAMVVYGLLTYEGETGAVSIPNRELMAKFNDLLLSNEGLGYVHRLARESTRMLKATLNGDTHTMTKILEYVHDTESPVFSYNSEIELSAVVNLVYLAARDKYRIEREDKAGKGFVDFIFYPEKKAADAMILELKTDHTPDEAIQQIKDKQYVLRFKGKLGEKPRYTGRILGVGISYDSKTKKHDCKIEIL
ncbi:MAG: AAA family ATPase [Lachnospiraceae bacterium]|nr:AAA family ATPase [Lachnospiraceae bacterium]